MWRVPSTIDLFIIMGIPATIEIFKQSVTFNYLQLKIKTTTEKPKRMKLNFTQNIFTRTLNQAYKEISILK